MENRTAKLQPNTTQIPNIILDEWMSELTPAEFKVIMLIARQTYGWHKESDRISYSQLIEKTGYGADTITVAVKALRKSGRIVVTDSEGTQLHTVEECRGKSLYYRLDLETTRKSREVDSNYSENPSWKSRDTKETITKDLVINITKQRNADIDGMEKEFSTLTGLSKATDKKPRQWYYLFLQHKGREQFSPCLKFLIEHWPGVQITKVETIYRNFPVYGAWLKDQKQSTITPQYSYEIGEDGYLYRQEATP